MIVARKVRRIREKKFSLYPYIRMEEDYEKGISRGY